MTTEAIVSSIVTLIVAGFTVWKIARPLFDETLVVADQHNETLIRKERIYLALEELEVEYRGKKIGEEEYRKARASLVKDMSQLDKQDLA